MNIQTYPYMEVPHLQVWDNHNQSKAEMLEKHNWFTATYRWPIYMQSSLQIPFDWWPGMYRDPGPPLWFGQYGGSHLLVIWRYLANGGKKLLYTRLQIHVNMFVVFFLIFFTWSLWQSMFVFVPCDGRGWDTLRQTAKGHWAANVDCTICQIVTQHRRLQNWRETHKHTMKYTMKVLLVF